MVDWRIKQRARWLLVASMSTGALVGASAAESVRADDPPIPREKAVWEQPRVMDGRIYSIEARGTDVMVGGTFTEIRAADGGPHIAQPYLFKFNHTTGQIDESFRPTLNGVVEGIRYSPDGRSIFVGGDFTTVNGVARQRVVKLNAETGAVNRRFVANANNIVKDLDISNGQIVIGGRFRQVNGLPRERLAMLDQGTGRPLGRFKVSATESRYQFAPYVQELEISPDGRWLVVGGNFSSVGGKVRHQIAVVNLTKWLPRVANWRTDEFARDCATPYDGTWIRGIAVSPDSTFFAVGTTGAHFGERALCDTATRWELPSKGVGAGIQPTWTVHTGGDTHWAMHIIDGVVFAGGHQRWENNPRPSPGAESDGPGAVPRRGVAALDALTGVPLSWNPTRDRGRGIEAWASNESFVFAGSDTVIWNGMVRQRLAVLPLDGGVVNPVPDNIVLPVNMRVAIDGRLYSTRFDGSSFGPLRQVSGTGVDGVNWSDVRDGFVQRGQLVYFGPASAYYRRPVEGNAFGEITNLSTTVGYVDADSDLTPYDQPYGVAETFAATYADGRVYYTKENRSRLYWRWYSIESGIMGARPETATTGRWAQARALDAIGGWLYVAWSDGGLYRAKLLDDGGVDMATWTLVDDGASGIDWSKVDSMFSTQA